ncbi:hypothetical protein M9H77_15006 [Catharanthus roseus]|uniref:Uncharacterized protein n=1 Tax=Catharanthus roseus TaxID=4058 RepID=A0ACC0BPW2_CATRO|nr:hypothetical protein M9H77_15006 [Catharanthus roseus]
MKQKIIIEVPMHCDRCKSKAMKSAVAKDGVTSVSIESETNKLIVTGDGVDMVELTTSLRKKFAYAIIVSVEEVTPPSDTQTETPPSDTQTEKPPSDTETEQPPVVIGCDNGCQHPYPYPYIPWQPYQGYPKYICYRVPEYDPSNSCTHM